ncbi:NAD(P)H-binding protein [Saccharopolyspora elongata]|uniref:NAD-dependent epimerase/dehydratase family protein n=1 Tax=Saccharopolyspora elongata TaxID=2530387 RepID=A0A4R4Z0P1_9PSEU|nr:NAD(P)H-binding protein [Saccharopolyspora elongata]TDD51415.1 NAD-dependent epimerase/dehydratase family protein [Saccharopolyspora elongata]
MTVLVTGATGNVGRRVVDRLLAAGTQVRALTRRPEAAGLPGDVEVLRGDLADSDALAKALAGVDSVFLFPVPEGVEAFVDRAKAAGVRRVVVLSSKAVEFADGNAIGERHRVIEEAVEAGGFEWTFLRPGAFATNTLAWADSIRTEGVVREPFVDAQQTPIHEDDIAAVAATALLEDGHAGAAYALSGPEALTVREQVQAISAAIGREVGLEEQTLEQARAHMVAEGVPEAIVDALLSYGAQNVENAAPPVRTVEQVAGRPARTFAQWAVDHADDFR